MTPLNASVLVFVIVVTNKSQPISILYINFYTNISIVSSIYQLARY